MYLNFFSLHSLFHLFMFYIDPNLNDLNLQITQSLGYYGWIMVSVVKMENLIDLTWSVGGFC